MKLCPTQLLDLVRAEEVLGQDMEEQPPLTKTDPCLLPRQL